MRRAEPRAGGDPPPAGRRRLACTPIGAPSRNAVNRSRVRVSLPATCADEVGSRRASSVHGISNGITSGSWMPASRHLEQRVAAPRRSGGAARGAAFAAGAASAGPGASCRRHGGRRGRSRASRRARAASRRRAPRGRRDRACRASSSSACWTIARPSPRPRNSSSTSTSSIWATPSRRLTSHQAATAPSTTRGEEPCRHRRQDEPLRVVRAARRSSSSPHGSRSGLRVRSGISSSSPTSRIVAVSTRRSGCALCASTRCVERVEPEPREVARPGRVFRPRRSRGEWMARSSTAVRFRREVVGAARRRPRPTGSSRRRRPGRSR